PRLELLAQLKPILRPLAEQGEQRVTDAHRVSSPSSILGIVLGKRQMASGRSRKREARERREPGGLGEGRGMRGGWRGRRGGAAVGAEGARRLARRRGRRGGPREGPRLRAGR